MGQSFYAFCIFFGNESHFYKRFYKIKEITYCLYRKDVL